MCTIYLPQLNGQTGTINSTSLDILQNGQVQQTLTNGVIVGNQVCFTVTANDFPSQTGGYDFQANVTFNLGVVHKMQAIHKQHQGKIMTTFLTIQIVVILQLV